VTEAAVAVFGSSQTLPGSSEWVDAENIGARLGQAGIAVITGGYGGTMEAVSKGASETGGRAIGIIAPSLFPGRSGANPYVTDLIESRSLTDRIGKMVDIGQGAIALPGSIGTATELLVAWNLNHIARRNGGSHFPTVAVGEEWGEVATSLGSQVDAHIGDIHFESTAELAVDWMMHELKIPRF